MTIGTVKREEASPSFRVAAAGTPSGSFDPPANVMEILPGEDEGSSQLPPPPPPLLLWLVVPKNCFRFAAKDAAAVAAAAIGCG